MCMLHVHSSSFTVLENPSVYAARQQPSRRQSSVANLDALDCCWAGFTIKRNPPVSSHCSSSEETNSMPSTSLPLESSATSTAPSSSSSLITITLSPGIALLHISRLFIFVVVVIVGAGASTLSLTLRLQFESAFSALLVVLLPVCFIFHRVQFHVRATLPLGSVDGIAVASM
jgi:hypothetical protein